MCYIIKFYINFMYKTHINIPVENQNWVSRSTSVRAHKLKQYIFLGVHVQPEQKTITSELPWSSYRQESSFPTV